MGCGHQSTSGVGLCSMWRLICLTFFGAFAWGVTWDVYGALISSRVRKAFDALQVKLPPQRRFQLTHRAPPACNESKPSCSSMRAFG